MTDSLEQKLTAALTPDVREPPADRVAALRAEAAAARARAAAGPAPRRRVLAPVAAAAAVVAAVASGAVGWWLSPDQQRFVAATVPGTPEFAAHLRNGGVAAVVDIRRTGTGRIVLVRSTTLPVLPQGQYYEFWFVGPGDAPGARNRISAGTWHPDADGRTDVRFLAAVDPRLYTEVAITREAGTAIRRRATTKSPAPAWRPQRNKAHEARARDAVVKSTPGLGVVEVVLPNM